MARRWGVQHRGPPQLDAGFTPASLLVVGVVRQRIYLMRQLVEAGHMHCLQVRARYSNDSRQSRVPPTQQPQALTHHTPQPQTAPPPRPQQQPLAPSAESAAITCKSGPRHSHQGGIHE